MSGINTVFLLDRSAFDRIERLVRRYEQQRTKAVQQGSGMIDRSMRLTPEAYSNLDTSNMRADLDDPSSVAALLGDESKGVAAIRRAQALVKLFADHMYRNIKLPRGWNVDYIRRELKKLLSTYGTDIKRNLPRVDSMDRRTAIKILSASIKRNNTAVKDGAIVNTDRLTASLEDSKDLLQALLQGQQDLLKEQRDANHFARPHGSTPFTPGLDHTVRDFEYDDEVRLKNYPDSTPVLHPLDVSLSPQSFIQQAYDSVSRVKPGQLVPDSGVNTMDTSFSDLNQSGFGHGNNAKRPVFTKRWKPIIC